MPSRLRHFLFVFAVFIAWTLPVVASFQEIVEDLNNQRDAMARELQPSPVFVPLTQQVSRIIGHERIDFQSNATLDQRRLMVQTIARNNMLHPHRNFFEHAYFLEAKAALPVGYEGHITGLFVKDVAVRILESFPTIEAAVEFGVENLSFYVQAYCQRLVAHKVRQYIYRELRAIVPALEAYSIDDYTAVLTPHFIDWYGEVYDLHPGRKWQGMERVNAFYLTSYVAGSSPEEDYAEATAAYFPRREMDFVKKFGTMLDGQTDKIRTALGVACIFARLSTFATVHEGELKSILSRTLLTKVTPERMREASAILHEEKVVSHYNEALDLNFIGCFQDAYQGHNYQAPILDGFGCCLGILATKLRATDGFSREKVIDLFQKGELLLQKAIAQGRDSSKHTLADFFYPYGCELFDYALESFNQGTLPIEEVIRDVQKARFLFCRASNYAHHPDATKNFYKAQTLLQELNSFERPQLVLQKPGDMGYLDWLQQLEAGRSLAELYHQPDLLEAFTRAICETITEGSALSDEEIQVILASVLRTRDSYPGKPDILGFYFGHNRIACWQRLQEDKIFASHMGLILAVDGIRWGLTTDRPAYDMRGDFNPEQRGQEFFEGSLDKQFEQEVVDKEFIADVAQIVADIHDDADEEGLLELMMRITPTDWRAIIKYTQLLLSVCPPPLTALSIVNDICVDPDGGYKGWQAHKVNELVSWLREGGEAIRDIKMSMVKSDRSLRAMVHRSVTQSVVLTPDLKESFEGLEPSFFDGTHLANKYLFYRPVTDSATGGSILSPLYFYLTRKVPASLSQRIFARELIPVLFVEGAPATGLDVMRGFGNAFTPRLPAADQRRIFEKTRLEFKDDTLISLLSKACKTPSGFGVMELDADRGIQERQFAYAQKWEKGVLASTRKKARLYYKVAALGGHKESQCHYGVSLLSDNCGRVNASKARFYLKRGAQDDINSYEARNTSAEAQFQYARLCFDGKGGPVNKEEATVYCNRAEQQGHTEATILSYRLRGLTPPALIVRTYSSPGSTTPDAVLRMSQERFAEDFAEMLAFLAE